MIWTIASGLPDLLPLVEAAGEPDQAVIAAFQARTRRQQHAPKHVGVKRWYYLLLEDPRISFSFIGMPLADWRGGAMVKVGTHEIIGEFPGNQHLVGQQGLRLQCEPLDWLREGSADMNYMSVEAALSAISMQILDVSKPKYRHVVRGKRGLRPRDPQMF